MGAQPSCKVLLCPWCKEEGHTDPVTVPVPLGTLEEMHCEEHGEKVCFFCGHDAQLLCTRCREGPSHHTHAVGFLDGACQPNQSCRNFNSSLRGPSVMDAKNHLSHHPVTRSASDFSEAPLGSLTRPHPHNRHEIQALSASPRHWTASDVLPASTLSVSDHPPTLHEDGVRTQLEALRVEGEEIEDIKSREDQKFQMLLTHIEIRKQQVEAVFEKLQQELREQRGLLLARLRGLEVQVCEEREDYISKFSEEVARHRAEAKELENCQQLASVLLHVGGSPQPASWDGRGIAHAGTAAEVGRCCRGAGEGSRGLLLGGTGSCRVSSAQRRYRGADPGRLDDLTPHCGRVKDSGISRSWV
ncbi:E3 ubiquitin-protein ligase TRIM15-like isoform X1 [Panthera onca]|uniref:E3 ubiquitin-protein ligase TRIM15-like n=1 Tax=Panthera onca TaxID=9690 RepID=UPI002955B5ED|nr:E3 ubiquitin-protein ligase TRIM15-like [Panthera onca]XP_060470561.1 E3 ubiquitin-protein ligase TRIM15-like [Panthera onca]